MHRRCAALLALAVLLTPLTPTAASDTSTLRIAVSVVPNTLNPLTRTQTTESFIAAMMLDGLVQSTPDGRIVPQLAREVPTVANGGISRDGTTITYHLRPNLRWHDGAPLTSRDVAFTQSAAMNPNNNIAVRDLFSYVKRIDTPNPTTVVLHLTRPYAPFVTNYLAWDSTAVLPAHLLATKPEVNDVPFNAAPVGSGPFIFDHWDRGHEIVLRANDAYYLGKPRVRRIVVQLLGDENTRNVALRAGDTDWSFEASNVSARAFARDPAIRTDLLAVNGYFGVKLQTRRAPLDDVRVRRAVVYALDRVTLASKISGTSVVPASSDIGPASWAYDRAIAAAPYDPAKSRALLTSAGWLMGPGAIRARAGIPLRLQLVYPAGRPESEAYAVNVQSMLAAVGIAVDLKSQQPNVLFAPLAQHGTVFSGNFDLALLGFYDAADPDDRISFACSTMPPDGFNISRWCDALYDRLTAHALATTDRAQRKRDYAQATRRLIDQAPEAFIFSYKDIHSCART